MNTFKKFSAAILCFLMIFTAPLAASSCGKRGDKSKIIFVSEETFSSDVKLTEYGYVIFGE